MFHFARPWLLLLLMAMPLVVWLWLRARRGTIRFSNMAMLEGLPAGRSRSARHGGALLRGLGLLLIIIAMAGPRFADWRTRVPTQGIAIEIVLDVSGSMAAKDFQWENQSISRLEAAKRALELFIAGGAGPGGVHLDGRASDLVGVVTFATWPDSICPLTLSHAVLLRMLETEQPRSVPGESETNISDALALALQRLESTNSKRKVVVLISDGEHNVARPQSEWTPRQAAQIAANLRVPIYTIDAGGDSGADDTAGERPIDPKVRAKTRASAESTLRAVADITGGRYFAARDTAALLTVCQDIDRLEKDAIQSFQYRRYYEGFSWVGLAAFTVLLSLQLLEMTFWQRLP